MRKSRKPLTLDQEGNRLGGIGLMPGETSGTPDNWSFGASLFEFLNPGTVQREDEAIGKTPRTYTEVLQDSFSGMMFAAEETRQGLVTGAKKIATTSVPLIVAGVIAVAVIVVASKRR